MRKLILALRAMFTNGGSSAQAEQKPNILLLLSDYHSYPFVSCYGDSNVRTPVLDQLAAAE